MNVVPEHMAADHAVPTLKVWQAWQGRHSFCCDGRVMVGPDIGVTTFAAFLTTGASVAFWIFICSSLTPWFLVFGCALFLMTIGFMVATATTDPGIIPSNRGMEQSVVEACAQSQRFVEVNGVSVQLKWCRTCHIFRPPRAAHCSECNVCVERFDHHCPWMGQCIGRRNYRFFLGFVTSCSALCAYTIGASCYLVYRLATAALGPASPHGDFLSRALARCPVGVGLVAFCGLILLCVGPLACYHCSLVCSNRTTSEEIKETYGEKNPFDGGTCHNCHEACCEPRLPPRLLPRSVLSEPERMDTCGLIDASRYDTSTEHGVNEHLEGPTHQLEPHHPPDPPITQPPGILYPPDPPITPPPGIISQPQAANPTEAGARVARADLHV